MDKGKYHLPKGCVEKFEESKRDAISDFLIEASDYLTGGLIVVSSFPGSSFVHLRNTHLRELNREDLEDKAFVHKEDALKTSLALTRFALESGSNYELAIQEALYFPVEQTEYVIKAILEASRHEGSLPYVKTFIKARDLWN